jgi:hypothetical protein
VAEARLPVASESSGQLRWGRAGALADRFPWAVVGGVWAGWALAVLGVIVGGVRSGAIADPLNKWPHFGGSLWPLFTWDFPWYRYIAQVGYPHGHGGPEYAFFPLWPWILRASGSIPDWSAALALVVVASAFAFAGVVASSPSRSWRAAVVLACWPGSFVLLLAYPDVIALAAAAWAAAFALRGRPWLAGLLGALAAFARPTGFLIALPLAFVARGSRPGRLFAAGAPIAATAAVHAFFWIRSGNATAFLDAQALPIWQRSGPGRLTKWPGHVAHAFDVHAAYLAPAAVVAAIVVGLVAWRSRRLAAAVLAYACLAGAALLGAQSAHTRIESAIVALDLPLLAMLWWRGRRYFPWALFATVVAAISVLSGSVTSFGRQALFAFPLYWVVAEGPRPLRHPLVAAVAIAANVAYALTLAKYAP